MFTKKKMSKLHEALALKNVELLKKALKRARPADLLAPDPSSRQGLPALLSTIYMNRADLCDEILKFYLDNNMDINAPDSLGNTVLHVVCQERNLDERIFNSILRYPGINVKAVNVDGNTPLHYFCEKFSNPMCQEHLDKFFKLGADVNAVNQAGESLLHKACMNNSIRIILVTALIDRHADVNIVNRNGETPLHFAVRMNREDLLRVLLKGGADITIRETRTNHTPIELTTNPKIIERLHRVEELYAWLSKNIPKELYDLYRITFCREEMYLDVLPLATDMMLRKLGVKFDHIPIILEACEKLKKEQAEQRLTKATTTLASLSTVASVISQSASDAVKKNTSTPQMISRGDSKSISDSSPQLSRQQSVRVSKADGKGLAEALLQRCLNPGDSTIDRTQFSQWILESNKVEYLSRAGVRDEEDKQLGAGTSGKVYRALYKGKDVAIKILKPLTNEGEVKEFRQEFEMMCALHDPFIVHFYGACIEPKLALVMELCSRDTLYDILSNPVYDIGWPSLFCWMYQCSHALSYMHAMEPQVLHRDFKSLNVLMTDNWECRVSDFGLSRFNVRENMDSLRQMRGTITHIAPELCSLAEEGDKDPKPADDSIYTDKSDVYSLGIVLWELSRRCVTRKYEKPWYSEFDDLKGPGGDVRIILRLQKGVRPTLVSSPHDDPKQGTVPPEVEELYKCCVDQDPKKRPTASEVMKKARDLAAMYFDDMEGWNKYIVPVPEGMEESLEGTLPPEALKGMAAKQSSKSSKKEKDRSKKGKKSKKGDSIKSKGSSSKGDSEIEERDDLSSEEKKDDLSSEEKKDDESSESK